MLSALFLTACSAVPPVEAPPPREVPPDLLRPCEVPPRPRATLADLALILTDHVEALDCANGRIAAIRRIVTQ